MAHIFGSQVSQMGWVYVKLVPHLTLSKQLYCNDVQNTELQSINCFLFARVMKNLMLNTWRHMCHWFYQWKINEYQFVFNIDQLVTYYLYGTMSESMIIYIYIYTHSNLYMYTITLTGIIINFNTIQLSNSIFCSS